ncbi:MAG: tetratricopeptide repeat protein [Deltaproteobacteria bacterium]|nr:tetratricopeptide repeat protein [Deltaproteobacteria bacterium]
MIKKRVTRKDLVKAPDEFQTLTSKAIDFLSFHQKKAMVGVAVIVVVLALVLVVRGYTNMMNNRAMVLYNEGNASLEQALPTNDEAVYKQALAKFEQLVKDYPRSRVIALAFIQAGNVQYNLKNYDRATENYQNFLNKVRSDDNDFRLLAYNGLGYCYEALAKYKDAAEYYERAASVPDSYVKDQARLSKARVLLKGGNWSEALKTYEEILKTQADSLDADLIRQQINQINQDHGGASKS